MVALVGAKMTVTTAPAPPAAETLPPPPPPVTTAWTDTQPVATVYVAGAPLGAVKSEGGGVDVGVGAGVCELE